MRTGEGRSNKEARLAGVVAGEETEVEGGEMTERMSRSLILTRSKIVSEQV